MKINIIIENDAYYYYVHMCCWRGDEAWHARPFMGEYGLSLPPAHEPNEILIIMNKGTPKQRQLEAEFVSSSQSKHFERVKCALAMLKTEFTPLRY